MSARPSRAERERVAAEYEARAAARRASEDSIDALRARLDRLPRSAAAAALDSMLLMEKEAGRRCQRQDTIRTARRQRADRLIVTAWWLVAAALVLLGAGLIADPHRGLGATIGKVFHVSSVVAALVAVGCSCVATVLARRNLR